MAVSDSDLLKKAKDIMKQAYCPYSKFPVGAALLTDDDTIILGVNCENASYGGGVCAERNAVTTALTQGYRKFKAIAVATELENPESGSPCGICRQFLIEFGDYEVILGSSVNDKVVKTSTSKLLPYAFTPASLDDHAEQTSKR
ncbi:cytidine deaminase [Oesophagostomum dentatum]|uniref:Cytidine deaminase n=1 Tax=Oesophagostomum dentatum TaxID=61180 RepID=A0A0B1TTE8_OESDE|nr:cytidine deaminase [Oesophagostomum dentatum]